MRLNYHHLRYFRAVATEGHLGDAAARLNVSQSALSTQIKQLEDSLGHALFDRVGRKLVLTEAGRIALDHADRIFGAGDELVATLRQEGSTAPPLRIGAQSTLSRNFQVQFLRPLLGQAGQSFTLKSGSLSSLLTDLETLSLDVVLTTQVPPDAGGFAAQRIADQPVGLHGQARWLRWPTLTETLRHAPVILPTESTIRTGFDHLCAQVNVRPNVVASVDDMAMVRLLAREGIGLAVAPAVVLADELKRGELASAPFPLGISEPFFAVTLPRRFPHPALRDLLHRQTA